MSWVSEQKHELINVIYLYIYLFKYQVYTILSFSADLIDVVKDQLHGTDYAKEEDPKFYVSDKTGRGPLHDNWISDYWEEFKVAIYKSQVCIIIMNVFILLT